MKMVNLRSLGKEPLPGDRQGMSGAGAGHDSMRDVGGRVLRRRAPVAQQTTASQQEHPRSQQRSRTPPAEGAAPELQPALTQAGLPRQRMKWTASMNESVMRIYYTVTQLEQDTIGYRQRLHQEFCRKYPQLQVTEQRVADQYRTILRNRLIPNTRLNVIKREVEQNLQGEDVTADNENIEARHEQPLQQQNQDMPEPTIEIPDQAQQHQADQLVQELLSDMRTALVEFDGTDPLSRAPLPQLNSSKKLAVVINLMNRFVLPQFVADSHTLEQLHMTIYCAATTICKSIGVKIRTRQQRLPHQKEPTTPHWERRLRKKVDCIRKDIGRLTEHIRGVRTHRIEEQVRQIMTRERRHSQWDPANSTITEVLDTLKQKLSVFAGRLKRYKASNLRKSDNALFERSQKTFYRRLNCHVNEGNNTYPSKEQTEEFWRGQLSTTAACNTHASWIEEERESSSNYTNMPFELFRSDEISNVIKNLHNWKAPGPDQIQNFWIKKLWCVHEQLTSLINDALLNPQNMPAFLTQGTTYLLPKGDNTEDPAKYRPITCLPTLYKVITSCLAHRIYAHCEINNIIAIQQRGCAKNAMGSKEQLIIDSVVCNLAYSNNRNLFSAYIDYKKAFDSVPHEWLINILQIYKVNPTLIRFLEHVMSTWRTAVQLRTPTNDIETGSIRVLRGIFQGDALSPLWFCLAMNPLSNRLNSTSYGFNIKNNNEGIRLSHLLYMDDLKLMASTRNQLEQMLKIVEEFSLDIDMKFGLDKCRTLNVIRGKLQQGPFDLSDGQTIQTMLAGDTYKYLGMRQALRIDHGAVKKELTAEFTKRIRQVTKTNLNSKNLFQAINTYACPILDYSFGVVNWSNTDIERLQRKVRTLLTKAHKHHPRSAIERTTLPRHLGGRGLADLKSRMARQITNLRDFFYRQSDTSLLHRNVCAADHATPLKLFQREYQIHHHTDTERLQTWLEKPLHGRHPNEIGQEYVDKLASNYWLTSGQMFPETEGFLLAIQDQVVPTRNYLKYIIKDASIQQDACRYGCRTSETIQHITGSCQAFAATEYKQRHDAVAKILHQEIAEKLKLLPTDRCPYYKYTPESVLENDRYKLYWDRTVLTDHPVAHNRPDLIMVDRTTKSATFIDIAVPNNNNVRSKHTEKVLKYRELEEEVKRQWRMEQVQTVPVVISSTGIIPKSLPQNLKKLGLNEHLFQVMQKAVLLATARTVRKFLGVSPNGPDNRERAPTELNPL